MSSTTSTAIDGPVTPLPDDLRGVVDRAAVAELLDRFIVALDDHELDDAWLRSVITDDVRFEFPLGQHEGVEGLAAFLERPMARFERTHHLASPAVVDVDGDRATLRANMIAAHVHPPAGDGHGAEVEAGAGAGGDDGADGGHGAGSGAGGGAGGPLTIFGTHMDGQPRRMLLIGTHMDGEAQRAAGGWRLRRLTFRLSWMMGDPPPGPGGH
jgi:hypothetical protein